MSEVNETKKSQAVHEGDRKFTDLHSRVRTLENLCYSAKEVLNLEEAASSLGIAKSTFYKMTHENRIPFYKPAGKLIYFERASCWTGSAATASCPRRKYRKRPRRNSLSSIPKQADNALQRWNRTFPTASS